MSARRRRATAQQRYYEQIPKLAAAEPGSPQAAALAVLRRQGPPEPEPCDPLAGKLAYLRHRADQGDAVAAGYLRRR